MNELDNALFCDFETASQTDLPAAGLGRYLVDPTTRPTCLTFRLPGMSATDLWEFGKPFPRQLKTHVERGGHFWAHNAPFDYSIWNEILAAYVRDLPRVKIEQVRCSAARARYNGLPGSLEGACEAMGLPIRKDTEGKKTMLLLAAHPEWTPQTHPQEYARKYSYAITDTDAMIGLIRATIPLPPGMQARFEMDMRINARGFGCDVEAAQAMEELKLLAEEQLDFQIMLSTRGGVLAVTEVAKIKEYATKFDEEMDDASRETLKTVAARTGLPDELKQVLELRLDASRAPKKSAAILRAHVGGRLQHSTLFHGALSGRSTARGAGGAQTLNYARPRREMDDAECAAMIAAIKRRDVAFLSSAERGPLLAALADAQRSLHCATWPDHVLVDADLSQIEARMAPWLANDEKSMVAYEKGLDLYKITASIMFGVPYEEVTNQQRQVAKVARLAMVYGGGAGAFNSMAANYGVHLPAEQVDEIVFSFRAGEPELERWWSALEYAVLVALDPLQHGRAVEVPIGRGFQAKVSFVKDGPALRMVLPSGRSISYHNARLHLEAGANVPTAIYDKPEGYIETLDRKILSNNLTQGLSADHFWEVMLDVDKHEAIVHHIYDQVILEVPAARAKQRLDQLIERMRITPRWAPGLPLDAAGYYSAIWKKD